MTVLLFPNDQANIWRADVRARLGRSVRAANGSKKIAAFRGPRDDKPEVVFHRRSTALSVAFNWRKLSHARSSCDSKYLPTITSTSVSSDFVRSDRRRSVLI